MDTMQLDIQLLHNYIVRSQIYIQYYWYLYNTVIYLCGIQGYTFSSHGQYEQDELKECNLISKSRVTLICIKHIFPSYAFDYIFFIYVRSSYIADLNSSLINQFELCFHFFYVSVVHRLTTDNSTTEKSNMSDSAPIIVAE